MLHPGRFQSRILGVYLDMSRVICMADKSKQSLTHVQTITSHRLDRQVIHAIRQDESVTERSIGT